MHPTLKITISLFLRHYVTIFTGFTIIYLETRSSPKNLDSDFLRGREIEERREREIESLASLYDRFIINLTLTKYYFFDPKHMSLSYVK